MALKDVLDFEQFNLRKILRNLKEDPERLLLGGIGPFGTALWGEVLNKDYDPLVNALGRPVPETFQQAQAQGIDTGPASGLHDVASVIAGAFGAKGLGNLAGGAGGMSDNPLGQLPLPNLAGSRQPPTPPSLFVNTQTPEVLSTGQTNNALARELSNPQDDMRRRLALAALLRSING